jgi:deoxyribonuclease-4
MWAGPPVPDDAAQAFRDATRREGLKATAVHHGYLANLASPKKPMLARSRTAFRDELGRAEKLGVDHLIFHPGAHLESGVNEGLRVLVESLDEAFRATPGLRVRVLLENSAGQGTSMGRDFATLAQVLDRLAEPDRAGVAIDTCHLFASGVEFRTPESYGTMIDRLGTELGASRVHAFHLNDAKADLGSHLDRHENIGRGQIGLEGFRSFVNDPLWAKCPGYLETPLTDEEYAAYVDDLASLRRLVGPARDVPKPAGRSARARRRPTPK